MLRRSVGTSPTAERNVTVYVAPAAAGGGGAAIVTATRPADASRPVSADATSAAVADAGSTATSSPSDRVNQPARSPAVVASVTVCTDANGGDAAAASDADTRPDGKVPARTTVTATEWLASASVGTPSASVMASRHGTPAAPDGREVQVEGPASELNVMRHSYSPAPVGPTRDTSTERREGMAVSAVATSSAVASAASVTRLRRVRAAEDVVVRKGAARVMVVADTAATTCGTPPTDTWSPAVRLPASGAASVRVVEPAVADATPTTVAGRNTASWLPVAAAGAVTVKPSHPTAAAPPATTMSTPPTATVIPGVTYGRRSTEVATKVVAAVVAAHPGTPAAVHASSDSAPE